MKNIYEINPSNSYRSLTAIDRATWLKISDSINRETFANTLNEAKFKFLEDEFGGSEKPDITCIYISSALAIDQKFRGELFPTLEAGFEFCRSMLDGNPWFLLNCRKALNSIDLERSHVMRDAAEEGGQIFMITKLIMKADPSDAPELFVLDGSNRAQLFAIDSFKERVKTIKLNGITFTKIGEFV
jgi:hypothetical protein